MKSASIIFAAALTATLGTVLAGGEGWSHDFKAAQEQATKEEKSLLIDFTGSDWCGWCIKLNDEVFKHDAFKTGVKDKFVLVEIDFPQDESKLDEATKSQNAKLQEDYGIQGFPTILLTDAAGKPFAATGYQEGGPEKYVAHLDELLAKRKTRDDGFAAAAKLEGVAKAEALVKVLQEMGLEDAQVAKFYGDTVEQIKAADPEDKSGYVKGMETKAKYAEFQAQLAEHAQAGEHDKALALVDEALANGGYEGDTKQEIAAIKGMIYAQTGKLDEALKAMDEAKAMNPESEIGQQIDSFKERINQMKEEGAEGQGDAGTEEDAEAPAEEGAE
ncbi:MAG: thioredoxin family protein [Akkermansiaceae bacterium]|jgi:thioredoxin-related protein|nr:thioredoxin family protein [Akkermansiaceae bacterium]